LTKIASSIHKEAYPTATLGLIHMRRGHLDKAVALYEDAVRLADKRFDKMRIRQKLNLELGLALSKENPPRARVHLERAADAREGEEGLAETASSALKLLSRE
jgi:hypothetical protein